MKKIAINPAFEFIYNENDTVTIFDENMTVIYSLDNIGTSILRLLEKPINEKSLLEKARKRFSNVNIIEFNDFITQLKAKQIAIEE